MRLRVRVNDELVRWILGLGPSAIVVAPISLRDAVVAMAKEIQEKNSKRIAVA